MEKRVRGRRRSRGGAPITNPQDIHPNKKYKVSLIQNDGSTPNKWEFRLKPDQMNKFNKSIIDTRIDGWMSQFENLTAGVGENISIEEAKNKVSNPEDQILVCALGWDNPHVDFVNIHYQSTPIMYRPILIYAGGKFYVYYIYEPDGNSVFNSNAIVQRKEVSIQLSMMSQGIDATRNFLERVRGPPKTPLPNTQPVQAGGKSRRKKRVNRKKHTRKIRQ
jgi:hypothetical protein